MRGPYDLSAARASAWAGAVVRSVGARPWAFVATVLAMVALTGGVVAVMPRSYEVKTRLFVRTLSPVQGMRDVTVASARKAAHLLRSEATAAKLVRETRSVEEWRLRRAPLSRVLDRLRAALGRSPTAEELAEGLAARLRNELVVTTSPAGIVEIALPWPDPVAGQRLVAAAKGEFVSTAHALEMKATENAIAILEAHSGVVRQEIDRRLRDLGERRFRLDVAPRAGSGEDEDGRDEDEDPEQDDARAEPLGAAGSRMDRLALLRAIRFAEALARPPPPAKAPPPVDADTRLRFRTLEGDPWAGRSAERADGEGGDRGAEGPDGRPGQSAPVDATVSPWAFEDAADVKGTEESTVSQSAQSELRRAVRARATLADRIVEARIALDTLAAGFEEQYVVLWPPELPHGPTRPDVPWIMAGALADGLLLGLFATTRAPRRAGRRPSERARPERRAARAG